MCSGTSDVQLCVCACACASGLVAQLLPVFPLRDGLCGGLNILGSWEVALSRSEERRVGKECKA